MIQRKATNGKNFIKNERQHLKVYTLNDVLFISDTNDFSGHCSDCKKWTMAVLIALYDIFGLKDKIFFLQLMKIFV
jgi:hypothetical protein